MKLVTLIFLKKCLTDRVSKIEFVTFLERLIKLVTFLSRDVRLYTCLCIYIYIRVFVNVCVL